MKLSYFINLVLFILVLLLLWINKQPNSTVEQSESSINSLSTDSIKHITVFDKNDIKVELAKQNAQWHITAPINAIANKGRIALLLSILEQRTNQKLSITSATNLADFGLEKPAYSLLLNEQLFEIGDAAPLGKKRYLKHNDEIYIVDDTIAHLLNSNAYSFIENKLIEASLNLKKVELPSATFKLTDGHWQSDVELSKEQILSLIEQWQNIRALQVFPATNFVLTPPEVKLWFDEIDEPLELSVQVNETSLNLIDHKTLLNYQLTAQAAKQLFLSNTN